MSKKDREAKKAARNGTELPIAQNDDGGAEHSHVGQIGSIGAIAKKEPIPDDAPAWAVSLQQTIKNQADQIKILTDLAGKAKIEDWKDANKKILFNTVTLKVWDGKIVIGWGNLDYSDYNKNSGDAENEGIYMNLKLVDGSAARIPYIAFVRSKENVTVKVLRQDLVESVIELPDGNAIKIGNVFLNA